MEKIECYICLENKDNLIYHGCTLYMCMDCRLGLNEKNCSICKKEWGYTPIKLFGFIKKSLTCQKHFEFELNDEKIPMVYCKACLKIPENLETVFIALYFNPKLPEYLKFICKFIDKSQKEFKLKFVELCLSFFGICCGNCLINLQNDEKSLKLCEKCYRIQKDNQQNIIKNIELIGFTWASNEDKSLGNLIIKSKAIEYFASKFNYMPNFRCKECNIPFEYHNFLPIAYEENSITKMICLTCSSNKKIARDNWIHRYEFSRLCIKNCGNPGECLLECSHTVCYDCSTGYFFKCCNIVSNIEEYQKSRENYFYLCDAHQIPSDLYSQETCKVYCKLCVPEGKTYKISENFEKFSRSLSSNLNKLPIRQYDFMKSLGSEQFKLCQINREKKSRINFFKKIVPENNENISQMWILNDSDTHLTRIKLKTGVNNLIIHGLYITAASHNTNAVVRVDIKKNGYFISSLFFQLMCTRCQFLEFPLKIKAKGRDESNFLQMDWNGNSPDVVEFKLSYSDCSRCLCFSGFTPKYKNSFVEVFELDSAGIIYGLAIMIPQT